MSDSEDLSTQASLGEGSANVNSGDFAVKNGRGFNPNRIVNLFVNGVRWQEVLGSGFVAPGLELYLENDFSLSASNTYDDPFKKLTEALKKVKPIKKALDVVETFNTIGSVLNVKLVTRATGAKAWIDSSPLSFDLKFSFYMGMAGAFSGRTEVYNPIALLGYWALPRATSGVTMSGPAASYGEILASQFVSGLRTVGELLGFVTGQGTDSATRSINAANAQGAAKKEQDDVNTAPFSSINANEFLGGITTSPDNNPLLGLLTSGYGRKRSITIGGNPPLFNFSNVLPTKFTYSFSSNVDDEGYPISGSCSISCETLLRAASNDIPPNVKGRAGSNTKVNDEELEIWSPGTPTRRRS